MHVHLLRLRAQNCSQRWTCTNVYALFICGCFLVSLQTWSPTSQEILPHGSLQPFKNSLKQKESPQTLLKERDLWSSYGYPAASLGLCSIGGSLGGGPRWEIHQPSDGPAAIAAAVSSGGAGSPVAIARPHVTVKQSQQQMSTPKEKGRWNAFLVLAWEGKSPQAYGNQYCKLNSAYQWICFEF